MSRALERATYDGMRSVEEIREEPLSEFHERLKQRSGDGEVPVYDYSLSGKREVSTRKPWYVSVINFFRDYL